MRAIIYVVLLLMVIPTTAAVSWIVIPDHIPFSIAISVMIISIFCGFVKIVDDIEKNKGKL